MIFIPELEKYIIQLNNKSSPKRRSAAKKLRKLKDKSSVNPLIDALKKEIRSPKTWETQYHIIGALGEIGDPIALHYLFKLLPPNLLPPMVNLAIGDAITRLEKGKFKTLQNAVEKDHKDIVEGSLRAIALLHLLPDEKLIEKVLSYVGKPENESLRFWAVAAAAGWDSPNRNSFLHSCLSSLEKDTVKAATASLSGEYLKWNPL